MTIFSVPNLARTPWATSFNSHVLAEARPADPASTRVEPPAQPHFDSLEEWYTAAAARPSNFYQHVPILRALADRCDSVAEVSLWALKPALVALAASKARSVTSYCPAVKPEYAQVARFCGGRFRHIASQGENFEPADLLFLDTRYNAATVHPQLLALHPKVNRYIVLHCTTTYGEQGDDGGPGLLPAAREFLKNHPEWTAVRSDPNNHGLLVLSKAEDDKKQPPGMLRKMMNFSKALAEHAKDGGRLVADEVHATRLEVCVLCPHRHHDSCGLCGCKVDLKASWASSECPDSPPRWGKDV